MKLAIAEGAGSQIRMTNAEIRRNDEIPMTKPARATQSFSAFELRISLVTRHSSFNFLCAFLSVFGWQPPACGASSVLGAWLDSQTHIQTWSAEVIQTRALKSLAQPLTATGRVWFAAPNRFRWELGNPPQTIALRQPDQMLVIYPKLKRAEKYPLTRNHAGPWTDTLALLEAGFPRSQSELESRFRIESEATADGVHEITLQPKSASARRMMPHIKIAFATNDFSLRGTELQFADGSTMRNDFTNAVLNPKLDDSLFTPKVDPTFKVIEPFTQK
jgi:outer membrane lipoprotein-sorting protein